MNSASPRHPAPGRPSLRSPELAGRLRAARNAAGLSQRELADRLNASNVTVSRYESGSLAPSLRRVRDIARALGCAVPDLLGSPNASSPAARESTAPAGKEIESPMDRLPDVYDWWIDRVRELRHQGLRPQDIASIEATVLAIDAVRLGSFSSASDRRTAPEIIKEWEVLLPYLLDASGARGAAPECISVIAG